MNNESSSFIYNQPDHHLVLKGNVGGNGQYAAHFFADRILLITHGSQYFFWIGRRNRNKIYRLYGKAVREARGVREYNGVEV